MKGIYERGVLINTRVKGESIWLELLRMKRRLKSFPDAHIRRTMKRKSERHHYFCEESEKIIEFLNAYRIDRSMCVEG